MPKPSVFTLFFVSSRYGWEEMQRVDVFTSCLYPVYISWIMDSVSYLLLGYLGGCFSLRKVFWGCSALELLWGWEGTR